MRTIALATAALAAQADALKKIKDTGPIELGSRGMRRRARPARPESA